jgi:hypothetical protein
MDKFKTTNNDKVLTLAWEKAATRETNVFHQWRYFVAGGETLHQIETAISDFATLEQSYADLAKKAGAKSYNGRCFQFDYDWHDKMELTGDERVDMNLSGREQEPFQCARISSIPGFVMTDSRSTGNFYPDVAMEEGRELRDACMAIKDKANPAARVASWLESYGVSMPANPEYPFGTTSPASATVTKIGGDWIVAVPVISTPNDRINITSFAEEWATPPDSKPLDVSEYFALLEKNGLVKNTPKAPKP